MVSIAPPNFGPNFPHNTPYQHPKQEQLTCISGDFQAVFRTMTRICHIVYSQRVYRVTFIEAAALGCYVACQIRGGERRLSGESYEIINHDD